MSDLFKKQRTLETFLNRKLDDFKRRPVGPRCPKCHRPAPDGFCVVHGDVEPTFERFEKPFHMEMEAEKRRKAI